MDVSQIPDGTRGCPSCSGSANLVGVAVFGGPSVLPPTIVNSLITADKSNPASRQDHHEAF